MPITRKTRRSGRLFLADCIVDSSLVVEPYIKPKRPSTVSSVGNGGMLSHHFSLIIGKKFIIARFMLRNCNKFKSKA